MAVVRTVICTQLPLKTKQKRLLQTDTGPRGGGRGEDVLSGSEYLAAPIPLLPSLSWTGEGSWGNGWTELQDWRCLEDNFTVSTATISPTALPVQGHFTSCEKLYIPAIQLVCLLFQEKSVGMTYTDQGWIKDNCRRVGKECEWQRQGHVSRGTTTCCQRPRLSVCDISCFCYHIQSFLYNVYEAYADKKPFKNRRRDAAATSQILTVKPVNRLPLHVICILIKKNLKERVCTLSVKSSVPHCAEYDRRRPRSFVRHLLFIGPLMLENMYPHESWVTHD